MGLLLPPCRWTRQTSNVQDQTSASVMGTNFTAGASNADGAEVTLLTSLAHDVQEFNIAFHGTRVVTTASNTLATLLIDPAGGTAFIPLISYLTCGYAFASTIGQNNNPQFYSFPLFIPKGASIGLRARTSHTVDNTACRCIIYARGCPSRPDRFWYGQGVETLGVTEASSVGTSVASGITDVWGSWTNVGSTTTRRYGAIQVGFGGTDAGTSSQRINLQVGVDGTNPLSGLGNYVLSTSAAEALEHNPMTIPNCDIPAGTQLKVRIKSHSTGETHNIALYGVY